MSEEALYAMGDSNDIYPMAQEAAPSGAAIAAAAARGERESVYDNLNPDEATSVHPRFGGQHPNFLFSSLFYFCYFWYRWGVV